MPGYDSGGTWGKKRAGVDVDGVPAGRLDDGHARGHQPLVQVLGRADAVAQVRLLDHLLEPAGHGLEVVPGEAAVGGEALGEDEEVAAALRQGVVVHGQEAADVGEAVLLGRHRAPVGAGRTSPARSPSGVRPSWPGSRFLMKYAFSAKRQASRKNGFPWRSQSFAHAAQVLERDGLPAARVVGDRDHDERHARAVLVERALESDEVDVPLERVEVRRHAALGDRRGRAPPPSRPPRSPASCRSGCCWGRPGPAASTLWKRIVSAARPWWVGMMWRKPREVVHDVPEAEEGPASRVRLVALHDRAPLRGRHGARPGVGEEVDEHVLGPEAEDVVSRLREGSLAVLAARELHRLHRLDPERLDDRPEVQHEGPRSRGAV